MKQIYVFIEKCKTDICREGDWLHLSKLGSCLGRPKLLLEFINTSMIKDTEEHFTYRQICNAKKPLN